MRFARVVKVSPRSAALAALFGAMIALTVPAALVRGGEFDPAEATYPSSVCSTVTCTNFTFTNACSDGSLCKGAGTVQFYTCQPQQNAPTCTNSDSQWGHIQCTGKCQNTNGDSCNFIIYFCKN